MKAHLSLPRRSFAALLLLSLLLGACQVSTITPPVVPSAAPAIPSPTVPESTPTHAAPTSQPTEGSPLGVLPEELKGKRVHFWFSGSQVTIDSLNARILDFNGTNGEGIWVEAVAMGSEGELSERIQPVLGSPDQPDLVLTSLPLALNWAKTGSFVDLNAYVKDPLYGLTQADQVSIPAGIWQEGTIGNQQVSVPGYRSAPILVYNQTWARELGFEHPPTTPQEFKQQACAAAQANSTNDIYEDNGLGGWIVDTHPLTAVSWLRAFGANPWADSDGNYDYSAPQAVQTFTFLKELFDAGCAWVARDPEPYGYFARRQAIFYSASDEYIADQEKALQELGSTDQWSMLSYPSSDKPSIVSVGPDYILLTTTPAEQLAAWLFVRWMLAPQNQAAFSRETSYLPARMLDADLMEEFSGTHPQWAQVDQFLPDLNPIPAQASWMTVQPILQDAFAQLFSATPQAGDVPAILSQLNLTIRELLEKAP